jgi:hypothetical protein
MTRQRPDSVTSIPHDVVPLIFDFIRVTASDLLRFSLVSKTWYTISNNDVCWRRAIQNSYITVGEPSKNFKIAYRDSYLLKKREQRLDDEKIKIVC